MSTKSHFKSLIAIGAALGLAAAGTAVAASAPENYENHCAKCHGIDGKGQTKMGKRLKVRDMTTEVYKQELDEAKAIVSLKEGITKNGKDVKKSFASELSDPELKALVAYVKELK
jgi:mono/diheme cytochrome c family protein